MMESFNEDFTRINCFSGGLEISGFKRGSWDNVPSRIFLLPATQNESTGYVVRSSDIHSLAKGFLVTLPDAGKEDIRTLVSFLALNRDALLELSNSFGVHIPKFLSGVGETDVFVHPFIVTQRVLGRNLSEVTYPVKERPRAKKELDQLYTSLSIYLGAKHQDGGPYIRDITYGGWGFNANTQFMWGKVEGDTHRKVYLVDLGPSVIQERSLETTQHNISRFMTPGLCEMIIESEGKIDSTLVNARLAMVGLIRSFDPKLLTDQPSIPTYKCLGQYLEMFSS